MAFINKQDFYGTLTEKHTVLDCYEKLTSNYNNDLLFFNSKQSSKKARETTSIKLFPSYLSPTFKDYKAKIVPQKKITGYAIAIEQKTDLSLFLKTHYSKSFRSNIKRFVNRLELCFTISYKMFHGDMSKEDYLYHMNTLHDMLTKRFEQRNERNKTLDNWDFYLKTTYNLINAKKASIFAIYNNDEPIHICINHHFNDIFFVSIPSYNIDYSKFALGNISIYKLLEWSINNDYRMLDMAYGDLEYKRRWSNLIYNFNHHIIHKKSNLFSSIKASIETLIISIKNLLKKYNVDSYIKKIQTNRNKKKINCNTINYKIETISSFDKNDLAIVDLNKNNKQELRKLVFDALYTSKQHLSNITIYKNSTEDVFFVISDTIKQKITF